MTETLLDVENLSVCYDGVQVLEKVSFSLQKGQILGIVGESGSGKSTVAKLITRLVDPTEGEIILDGQDITHLKGAALKDAYGKMQMVFQDPYSSLNPRKHIYEILSQPMLYHGISNKETVHRDVDRLLDMVGLPKHVLGRYPHEFSGGQRQRIGIARALSLNPRFLVCDEPVSALDVSIQAQILNLLRSLQKDLGLTCMFVGHGLGAVNYVSDRIAVMYLGKIVEIGPAQEVFHHPVHPYTRALIDAVPIADPKKREQKPLLTGEIGSSTNPPSGCRFHPRCPYATESCRQEVPELCSVFPGSSHLAACPYAIAQLTGGVPAYDAKMQQVVVEQKWR